MGKSNRLRRAAKQRKRQRARGATRGDRRPRGSNEAPFTGSVVDLIVEAANAARTGDVPARRLAIERLASEPRRGVAREAAVLLEAHVGRLWDRGWQPADVSRVVGRELDGGAEALVRRVVAAQAASYEALGRRVAPAWMAQVDEADAPPRAGEPYLLLEQGEWIETLDTLASLLALLTMLPALPELVDPPSRWRDGTLVASGALPDGLLERVRALLAKAEATTFDAEAESFTAKAQELMARHRIDRAMFDAGRDHGAERPLGRRIGIDDPYADARALLLAEIAGANGCRAVWSKPFGFTTVFGFAHELGAVEELFTSLLVQATAALRREGSKQDAFGRSRTTRFRRSFLTAFAFRIGERLRCVVADTVAAADGELGGDLLPVLASRADETRAAADAAFPETRTFAARANDAEGWHAGRLFGDVADLGVRRAVTRRSA